MVCTWTASSNTYYNLCNPSCIPRDEHSSWGCFSKWTLWLMQWPQDSEVVAVWFRCSNVIRHVASRGGEGECGKGLKSVERLWMKGRIGKLNPYDVLRDECGSWVNADALLLLVSPHQDSTLSQGMKVFLFIRPQPTLSFQLVLLCLWWY